VKLICPPLQVFHQFRHGSDVSLGHYQPVGGHVAQAIPQERLDTGLACRQFKPVLVPPQWLSL